MPRFLGHEWRDDSDACVCHGYRLDDVRAAAEASQAAMIALETMEKI